MKLKTSLFLLLTLVTNLGLGSPLQSLIYMQHLDLQWVNNGNLRTIAAAGPLPSSQSEVVVNRNQFLMMGCWGRLPVALPGAIYIYVLGVLSLKFETIFF